MTRRRKNLSGLAGALALLAGATAQAQTFPADAQWLPLTMNMTPIGDPIGDGTGARDLVGDAANPTAYVYTDGDHLFFRLRLDDDPLQTPDNYKPFGWACLFDTDNDLMSYEFVAGVDGIANPDVVELSQNTTPTGVGDPSDDAETLLASYGPATHARGVQAPSNINGSPDFFIDWAVDVADVQAAGITGTTPLRFICGTSNNARALTADLISEAGATTLPDLTPDPVTCDATGCSACAASEVCGDGIDNDCNGGVDEVCDCEQDSDCGDPQSGKVCDAVTDSCVPGCRGEDGNGCPEGEVCSSTDDTIGTCSPAPECAEDSDCGGPQSGTVCDAETQTCIPGCRGEGGNGCPEGEVCSSTDDTIGTCEAEPGPGPGGECAVDADCGAATSGSICDVATQTCIPGCRGADGNACPSGLACTSTDATAGACVGPDGVFAEGAGLLCAATRSPDDTSPGWLAGLGALAMVLGWRRRRRS